MATDTIVSGGTLTLAAPLTSGTNIEFLNNAGNSGTLVIRPGAVTVTSNNGTVGAGTIGGAILNMLPGDSIASTPGDILTLQTVGTLFNELDASANAAAENASFGNDITMASQSGYQIFIGPNGSVSTSVETPFTLDATQTLVLEAMRSAVLGTAANNAVLDMAFSARTNPNSNHPFIDAVVTTSAPINPCFAAGTMILTVAGEMPVEALNAGDVVVCHSGEERRIGWIGHRALDLARHPGPAGLRPVVLAPGALDDGIPSRRLTVSPDHALYFETAGGPALVQAKDLVNGRTIRQDTEASAVTYYHVELDAHDILIADGAAAESFLDTGHRGVFDNSAEPLILHPEAMQRHREVAGCAPLVTGGAVLAAIRERLAARSAGPHQEGIRPSALSA